MKHSTPHPDRSFTILALILTLVLTSIYYTPELLEETDTSVSQDIRIIQSAD